MSEPKETERAPEGDPEQKSAAGDDVSRAQPSDAEPEPSEGAEGEGQGEAESDEAPADADAAEAASTGEPRAVPKKKKAKAKPRAEAADDASPAAIRDRNQRVRAEAAEKRRAKREREQGVAPRRNLDASEVMDDALARSTHAAAGFLRRHFNKLQWAIMLGLVGWIAWEVYAWRKERTAEKGTEGLLKAISAETGKVGDATDEPDPRTGLTDPRRQFDTDEARLKATLAEYQLAASTSSNNATTLATFGVAGASYDLGKYQEAKQAYEQVRSSALAARDTDVKGRALEGLGMTLEALKDEAGAQKAFRELANLEAPGLSLLGLYHQARLLKAQGKNEDATKLLAKAGEKLLALKDNLAAVSYTREALIDLYGTLDSKASRELADKLAPNDLMQQLGERMGGGPGKPKLTKEKMEEILKNLKDASPAPAPGGEPAPGPGGAPAPMPAPSGAP